MDDIKILSEFCINAQSGREKVVVAYNDHDCFYHLYGYDDDGEMIEIDGLDPDVIGLEALPDDYFVACSGLKIEDIIIPQNEKTKIKDQQFKILLDDILSKIQNKYPYANGDPINDKISTLVQGKFDEYDEDSCIGGYYDSRANSIHINPSDRFDSSDRYHFMTHELLHFSSTQNKIKVHLISSDGEYDTPDWVVISGFSDPFGNYNGLNEGATEVLTNHVLGDDSSAYPGERKFVNMFIALMDNDIETFSKKYFDSDISIFKDVIGDKDKAFRFVKCIDMLNYYDGKLLDDEIYKYNEVLFEKMSDYAQENKIKIKSIDDLYNSDWDAAKQIEGEVSSNFFEEYFTPQIEGISFVSDAENILLDVFSDKLTKMQEDGFDQEKIDGFFYDFASNFIFYDDIVDNDNARKEGHIESFGAYFGELLNMDELQKTQNRFRDIMVEHQLEDVYDFYVDWSKGRKTTTENEEGIEEIEEIYYIDDEELYADDINQLIEDDDFGFEENDLDDEDELE